MFLSASNLITLHLVFALSMLSLYWRSVYAVWIEWHTLFCVPLASEDVVYILSASFILYLLLYEVLFSCYRYPLHMLCISDYDMLCCGQLYFV